MNPSLSCNVPILNNKFVNEESQRTKITCLNVNIRSLKAHFLDLEAFFLSEILKPTIIGSVKPGYRKNNRQNLSNFLVTIVSLRVIEVGESEAVLAC